MYMWAKIKKALTYEHMYTHSKSTTTIILRSLLRGEHISSRVQEEELDSVAVQVPNCFVRAVYISLHIPQNTLKT